MEKKVPIEVSARHVHLSLADTEALFGAGHELKKMRQLTQPSDFAAEETIDIKLGDRILKKVRVVGPARVQTQVELSMTDAFLLGVNAPVRISGDIKGSIGATLVGPNGEVVIGEGIIVAARHLHCATDEAKALRLKNGDMISVKVFGKREITFHNVAVRSGDGYKLCLHLDTDEGNAAGIAKQEEGVIVKG